MSALITARAITDLFAIAIHLCLSSVRECFLDTTSTVIVRQKKVPYAALSLSEASGDGSERRPSDSISDSAADLKID